MTPKIPDGHPMSPMTMYRRRKAAGLVVTPEPAPVDDDFFLHWSDELAWVLGMIWTDGCLFGNTIEVCSAELQPIELMMSLFGGRYAQKNRGRHVRLTWTSTPVTARLKELGLTERKSYTVRWPTGLPPEHEAAFMRGVIDGDGSVFVPKLRHGQQVSDLRVSAVSASGLFANDMMAWSRRAGLQATVTLGGLYKWGVYGQESLRRLHGLLYPHQDVVCLHRKRIPFDLWMETPRAPAGNPVLRFIGQRRERQHHKQTAYATRMAKRGNLELPL